MPLPARITSITEGVDFDRVANQFTRTKVVMFMVGDHGPFQLTIAGRDFSAAVVQQRIDQEAAEISKLFPGS